MAGQNTEKVSASRGTRTKARTTGGTPVARLRTRVAVKTAISLAPDLLRVPLPGCENGVDLLRLGEEGGESVVGGGLEGVAGVAVEELRDVRGVLDQRAALLDQRRTGVLGVGVGRQRCARRALEVDLLSLGRGHVAQEVLDF